MPARFAGTPILTTPFSGPTSIGIIEGFFGAKLDAVAEPFSERKPRRSSRRDADLARDWLVDLLRALPAEGRPPDEGRAAEDAPPAGAPPSGRRRGVVERPVEVDGDMMGCFL